MRNDEGDWRPVSNPAPLPVATFEDVKATLEGVKPGVYLAVDLYQRYCDILFNQKREPTNRIAFGRMLRDFGLIRRQKRGAAAWLIQ